MKKFLLLLLTFPLLAATQLPRGFQEDVVVYGLRQPTAAQYAPDGRLFILEKQGKIKILTKEGKLLDKPFLSIKVNGLYERGLCDIAFDPHFKQNHYVYIYYTTADEVPENRVERFTANGDVADLASRVVLLQGIHSDIGIHNAGCLRFGPDGKLYVSTGDGGLNPSNAQDLGNLNGKILRINSDGTIPSDNPFVNQPGSRGEIWCYGLRNPWRFEFDPRNGQMLVADVGGDKVEEINVGRAGGNYGWPAAEGPTSDSRFINPVYSYTHEQGGAAVIIGGFYTGKSFPDKYHDRLFFTDYARKFIKMARVDSAGQISRVTEIASNLDGPVHMTQGPGGSLIYVNFSAGEIRKIRFVGGKNRPPVVNSTGLPRSGLIPLEVRFSAKDTSDPDGDPLTYLWDFGDHSAVNTRNAVHIYEKKGTYYALLSVYDDKGGAGYGRPIKVVVGNVAPTAVITEPKDGTIVHYGETIHFAGYGTDPEDGDIPPENLKWGAKLYHDDHTHPALGGIFGTSGNFPIPPTFHAEGNLFYRLKLRVVDSEGLATTTTVDLPLQ